MAPELRRSATGSATRSSSPPRSAAGSRGRAVGTARRTARGVRELAREAVGRAAAAGAPGADPAAAPGSRSGCWSSERARHAPDETFFLFEDRAYTAGRGRRPDRQRRPRADLDRGAPGRARRRADGRPAERAGAHGRAQPARRGGGAAAARRRARSARSSSARCGGSSPTPSAPRLPRGTARCTRSCSAGVAAPREFDVPVAGDMEQIDPAAVTLPAWYRPNPGRAGGPGVRPVHRRGRGDPDQPDHQPALGAVGVRHRLVGGADATADTVYSVAPLYHPSGLMMSIGGAIAGGARLAMARRFDPETFWEEVRRYGVTVASYTWTLLHDIVEAPPHPGERDHPVRLFIGSGMPRGLWRRVQRRFAPARVLEFYASTEAGAILVNVRGAKPGSMGRPLPGSARCADRRLRPRRRASSSSARTGSRASAASTRSGMLLARVSAGEQLSGTPLRGVFAREDAWLAHRRPVPPRRRRRLLARGRRRRRDPHRLRARCSPRRSAMRSTTCRRSTWRSPTGSGRPRTRPSWRWPPITLRAGHELTARELAAALAGLDAARDGRRSCRSSTGSR